MQVLRFSLAAFFILQGAASSAHCAEQAADGKVFTQVPTIAQAVTREGDPAGDATKDADDGETISAEGPKPYWIWLGKAEGNEKRYFRRTFTAGDFRQATLKATCDNVMTVYLNGQRVVHSDTWQTPVTQNVKKFVKKGENEILVEAANQGSAAGLALRLSLRSADGELQHIVTDKAWQAAQTKDAKEWSSAEVIGPMGVGPWGDVFAGAGATLAGVQRNVFTVLPGFQVELLYTVPKEMQGSWVAITFDPKGRLIASDQGNQGLFRITPPPAGSDEPTKVEPLDAKITSAQGLLYAFDSLYVSVNGGPGSGLYRARDTNGDDQYDEVVKLKPLQGGGEHGPHAVRLSPDGKSLYVIAGNHTDPPQDFDHSRVPSNWGEDLLLPRQWDARGHARGKLAPGGWIARTDPDGKTWEIVSTGYRNSYDMDFNADGELFAYDADMEWDMGTPWYRPTRLVHAISGSEFGWRSGTGKWPTWFVDSLPEVVDIGPGSPVGVTFGYGAKFPAKYQNAIYLLDWTFGTIHCVHLEPDGASYRGVKEEFVARSPLPLTDAAVGPDGAFYFTVGGRGTQSELYRVTYVGKESTAPADAKNDQFADLRKLRRELEQYHVKQNPKAIDAVWPHLNHDDRHIRYAARVALEHQDVSAWQDRALAEKDPQALITTLAALARQGDKSLLDEALAALERLDYASLSARQQLELLRVYQLVFIRLGQPDQDAAARIARRLDAHFPAKSDAHNRELSKLLVYLNWPTVIGKTLKLMEDPPQQKPEDVAELIARNASYGGAIAKMLANLPEIQNLHYAFVLRNMRYGWTLTERKRYFDWLNEAAGRSGGASYGGFIENIRKEAVANMSPAEQKALASETIAPPPNLDELPKPKGPGQKWTTAEVIELAEKSLTRRDFENGRRTFIAARCAACHRFDGEGGATGPDLTNVAARFSSKDLAEALIEPSKVVSDQYRASVIMTDGGQVITGRIVGEEDGALLVMTDPFDATKLTKVPKDEIDLNEPSKVSMMPADLLNVLNRDEMLDMLAYMLSRGNPNDRVFARAE